MKPDSDFDFLVEFSPAAKIGLIEFGALQYDLEQLLGRKVDLIPAKDLKPYVGVTIGKDAQLIYAG
ncbi:MAG: hypothetical protein NVS9B14_19790 [Candidatus Acidiferrum sp.]